jgi:hypothetical protein
MMGFFWHRICQTICPWWLSTTIFLISACWAARTDARTNDLFFKKLPKCLPKWPEHHAILPAVSESPCGCTASPAVSVVSLLTLAVLIGMYRYLIVILICNFLLTCDVECLFLFYFWQYWGLNWGLHTCKAGLLLLESQPQPFLLFILEIGSCFLSGLGWTAILLFMLYGMTGTSYHTQLLSLRWGLAFPLAGLVPWSSLSQPPKLLGL